MHGKRLVGIIAICVVIGWAWSVAYRPVVAATALVAALNASAAPETSGYFLNGNQALQTNAHGVAVGDLNGDGALDLAFATADGGTAWWGVYDTLTFTNSEQTIGADLQWDVALSDMDGDTDLDMLLVGNAAGSISVWLNDGVGNFTSNGQTLGGMYNIGVKTGDVDNDGDQDVIVVRTTASFSQVWLNNGSGQLTNSGQALGTGETYDITVNDFDGDHDLDLFFGDFSSSQLWLNQGGAQNGTLGMFEPAPQELPDPNDRDSGVDSGDLDRDGDIDVVITKVLHGGLQAWLNDGDGNFTLGNSVLPGTDFRDAFLDDIDRDGDLDVFATTGGGARVIVNMGGYQGGTVGILQDTFQLLGTSFNYGAALADFDGDDDPDAITADNSYPSQVWRNEGLSGLAALYGIRDVMMHTTRGQEYAALYYENNPEILNTLMTHPDVMDSGYRTVTTWLPNFEALVVGDGATTTITAAQVDTLDGFLTDLSAAASPALAQTIAAERADLPPLDTFVGQTMTEAQEIVLGGAAPQQQLYLPLIGQGFTATITTTPALHPNGSFGTCKCILRRLLDPNCDPNP